MSDHEISPELVLVSPDLRESALGRLPSIDPDDLFRTEPRPRAEPRRRAEPRPRAEPEPEPAPPSLPKAVAAYAAAALFYGAIRAAVMFAVIVIAAFLLAR